METIHLRLQSVEDTIEHFKLDITLQNHMNEKYNQKSYHFGFLGCLYDLELVEEKEREEILNLINKQKEVL